MRICKTMAGLAFAFGFGGCHRNSAFTPPAFEDTAVLETVSTADLPEVAPGSGIASFGGSGIYEINIESDDGAKIRVGQKALISTKPEAKAIPARVIKVMRAVSAETGQALAWLKAESAAQTPAGEFVFATITLGMKSHALTVNSSALFVRDGKSWVIKSVAGKEEKSQLVAQEVKIGTSDKGRVEIVSGLHAGDQVVDSGGLGYLYPDFKSQGEGD